MLVKFTKMAVTGLVVGGLLAGLGATPAMATTAPTLSQSIGAGRPATTASATSSVTSEGARMAPGTAPYAPGAGPTAADANPRFLPLLLAAGRAFVAAVKVVPPAYAKLSPAVRAGASAVGSYIKNKAPGAAKSIVAGIATNTIWQILKSIFGF